MADIGSALTRKYGPLPGYAWGLGALVVTYIIIKRRSAGAATSSAAGTTPASSTDYASGYSQGLSDASGYYGSGGYGSAGGYGGGYLPYPDYTSPGAQSGTSGVPGSATTTDGTTPAVASPAPPAQPAPSSVLVNSTLGQLVPLPPANSGLTVSGGNVYYNGQFFGSTGSPIYTQSQWNALSAAQQRRISGGPYQITVAPVPANLAGGTRY